MSTLLHLSLSLLRTFVSSINVFAYAHVCVREHIYHFYM
jgi:hypothetical protein